MSSSDFSPLRQPDSCSDVVNYFTCSLVKAKSGIRNGNIDLITGKISRFKR